MEDKEKALTMAVGYLAEAYINLLGAMKAAATVGHPGLITAVAEAIEAVDTARNEAW